MVNYRQPVNSLGQAANIGQGNLLERVSILETRKRILVADASEEFRRVFTGALEEESGLELAAETGDGQETVRLAKELSPDIVVMDFVLARMDGLEVLSELAALPGRPRVLVLSSFARGNMAELAAAHGADYYMMKPCKLSAVMERHGIEWEDKGTHDKHLSVLDYKKEQRAKEIAALETVKAEKESQVESQERRLKELAPAVKDMERLAADFSTDPEEILPEAGTLESAKSYREKKAKPLLAKIVKVLRSLFRKYIDLKGKFDRLQGDYDRVREGNARLSDRLMEVKMENKKLRQISADYTRVKRVFGPEQVEAAVEADKQREQAEKGRKRPRRSLDRGGR